MKRIQEILSRITMNCLGTAFTIRAEHDNLNPTDGRIFLQVLYQAPCTKTGEVETWGGRKWYLSDYMSDDEIVKTAWCAFEAAVKHEVMEGFKVDNIILFNPHVDFNQLLKVSELEVRREDRQ